MLWFKSLVSVLFLGVCCVLISGCGSSDTPSSDGGDNTRAELAPSSVEPNEPQEAPPTNEVVTDPAVSDPAVSDPAVAANETGSDGNEVEPAAPQNSEVVEASEPPPSNSEGNSDSVNESDDTSDPQETSTANGNGETVIPRDPITGRPLPPRELGGGDGTQQPAKKVKTLGLEKIPEPKPTGSRTHFVTFDDLVIDMQQDQKFNPKMLTKKVVDLNNQRVKIQGFIFPALPIAKGIKTFPLVKNTECRFGPGGTAHHLVDVKMANGATVDYTTRIVTIEGILTIKPYVGFDGNTWSIYEMKCEKAY